MGGGWKVDGRMVGGWWEHTGRMVEGWWHPSSHILAHPLIHPPIYLPNILPPSFHLILCRPLLLLPPIPPSIRVFSNDSTLCMRWPKYWSFSFSIIPSKVYWYVNLDERRRGRNCTQRDTESSTYVICLRLGAFKSRRRLW